MPFFLAGKPAYLLIGTENELHAISIQQNEPDSSTTYYRQYPPHNVCLILFSIPSIFSLASLQNNPATTIRIAAIDMLILSEDDTSAAFVADSHTGDIYTYPVPVSLNTGARSKRAVAPDLKLTKLNVSVLMQTYINLTGF
jgi:hypothetical protein